MQPTTRRHLEAIVRDQNGHTIACCLIRRGRYTIGQHFKNEIVIDDPSVSARHAQLTIDEDETIFIEDLESANGILINGQRAQGSTRIGLDCKIEIGVATIQFQRGGLPAEVFEAMPDGFLRLNRYNIGEVFVKGSTSTIYEATDTSLGRGVALKVMRPENQANTTQVLRFVRDAQITSQLQHPGILPIYELSLNEQSQLFCTTRFVEAESLATILEKISAPDPDGPTPPTLALLLRIFHKVCDTIAYAHSRGVIHCGLRPEAITVGTFGEVFVLNWGLSKTGDLNARGQIVDAPLNVNAANSLPQNTAYTAPEQASAVIDDITPRTDIYSLGGLLYRMLCLKDPIVAENEDQLLEQILTGSVQPISLFSQEPHAHCPGGVMPEALCAIAMKALNHIPEERYISVGEMQRAVAALEAMQPHDDQKLWKQVGTAAWQAISARLKKG